MKLKQFLGLILALMLIAIFASGFCIRWAECVEPPETEWIRTYGGTAWEVARSVIQVSDGGYILAGQTESFGAGGRDFWLVKTDADGNMEWNKTYGGTGSDLAFSVVDSDGSYALAGRTNSFGAGTADFWLVKVDSAGNHEWNKTYGGAGLEAARCIAKTGDGGYVLAGFTQSFGAGGQDFWLVKVDSSGNHEWNKTYGGADDDAARAVVETSDGGYILAGETNSFGAGDTDFWLVKVDSSGNHEWNKTYGGGGNDPSHSMVEANVLETDDGGYVLVGFTQSFGTGGKEGWLVKTDPSGNMEWNKTFGGPNNDVLNSIARTADKGYVLAGFTQSSGAGGQDFWLVKVAGPPQYTLAINSSPVGVTFTVDSAAHATPWLGIYEQGTTVSLEMPEIYTIGDSRYYWDQWSDGNTSRLRTIIMSGNTTMNAIYEGPYYQLTIESSHVTGIDFTINGIPRSTPYMDWLLEGSYTVEMPQTYDGYVWSRWLEDGDTNRIKIIILSGSTTYTAVYGIPVGGVSVATESGYWHSRAWSVSILIMVSMVITLSICFKRKSAKE